MRDEEEEEMAGTSFLAGTRSKSLNAVTRKERKKDEQVQGEMQAGTSMTS